MRILLVGNYEPDEQQSMLRYTGWLERTLLGRGHSVAVVKPRPFFSRIARSAGLSKYLGYIDKFVLFPFRLRRVAAEYDLVHITDHSNSMYLRMVYKKPRLITCHDVLAIRSAMGEFPESPTGWSGRILQRWILSGLRRANHVLCVSSKTASDLLSLTGLDDRGVRVIYNPLNWNYHPGEPFQDDFASKLGLWPHRRYLLHVGGNQWYKNRLGVLHIFAHLVRLHEFSSLGLVMVGKPWTNQMRNLIQELELGDQVIEAAGSTNEELCALYGNALALLFPSLEEGFGWPILEAQACGCPVITTNRPPMSEVAGSAALLIDPADPEAAASAIARQLSMREQLREAGFRNLGRFAEESIADQYCALYERVLAEGPDSQ